MSYAIFSFGTLQLPDVQTSLFGRPVPSTPDVISGWKVGTITIADPGVIAMSGTDRHPALVATGDPRDRVSGAVLETSESDLEAADYYERVSFRRISVALESGRTAWIYVPREDGVTD